MPPAARFPFRRTSTAHALCRCPRRPTLRCSIPWRSSRSSTRWYQVVIEDIHPAIVVVIVGVTAHRRDSGPFVVVRHPPPQAGFFGRAVALVKEQEIPLGVVGDEDVLPAILVEIRDADAHALAKNFADAGLLGDVLELTVAQVVIEAVRHAHIPARIAVALAVFRRATDVGFRTPDRVIGDDQVEQTVVVIVEPRGRHAQGVGGLAPDAGALGDIGKRAVAIVVVQRVAPGVADEQIGIAVVVVIAHRHAKTEAEVFAWRSAITTTTAIPICSSATPGATRCTTTMATARLPMSPRAPASGASPPTP